VVHPAPASVPLPITVAELAALPKAVRLRVELLPLVYRVYQRERRLGELAPDELKAAQRSYYATLARNLRAFEGVRQLLDVAEADGLTVLPWKGLVFAEALYRDPGVRPMMDVDLLVRPGELERALGLGARLGYRRGFSGPRYTPAHGHDVTLCHPDGYGFVEVHYRMFHELGGDARVDALFERTTTCEVLGRPRRVAGWADQLFATAVHAATHAFCEAPLWMLDLALLYERAGGLEAAAAEAERRRFSVAFRAALAVAGRVLPTRLPPGRLPRATLLELALGTDWLGRSPGRVRSLLARAVLTDDPRRAANEVWRKLGLRAVELWARPT
jgi:hypothetical protein